MCKFSRIASTHSQAYKAFMSFCNSKAFQRNKIAAFMVLAIMLLAFGFKAVIPAGFMPENKNGFIELVICSGMDMKTVLVPSDDAPPSDHKEQQSDKICAFQTFASGKAIVPAPVAFLPYPLLEQVSAAIADNDVSPLSVNLSFEARGPPSV